MNFFKSKINIILLIILLVLLGVGGFFGYKMFLKPDVVAINYQSMNKDEINQWFVDNQIEDKLVFEEDYDDSIAAGAVIYQSVKEGDKIKDKVTIIISKGKDPNSAIEIPSQNQTYDSIKLWFQENGFNNVTYKYVDNKDEKQGTVLSISPITALKTDAIVVEIAGKEMYTVPDFSTYSKNKIDEWASEHGVSVKYLYESSQTIKEGGVIKQSIKNGESISKGGSISITLSQGDIKTATIPATLLGSSENDFLTKLKALGFTKFNKDSITYFSTKSAKGTVFSYDDGNLPLDETINYAISAGQYAFDKTEYEGKTLTKAKEMVDEYNKRNAHITLETKEEKSDTVSVGELFSCTSKFDNPNITISCKLSKGDGTTTKATLPTNLLGYSESNFLAKAKELGFTNLVKDSSGYYSTINAKDTIAYYDPDGEMLTNTKITYRLSLGPYTFNASDFNGKSKADAETLIKSLNGINAHIKSTINTSGSGNILSNCTASKSGIETSISCSLQGTSTSTETKATLPTNLLGYSESDFLAKAKSLGFTNLVKDSNGYYSTINAKDTIAYYDPDGELATNTKITYRLSLGPYTFSAAEYNGKTVTEAEAYISNLNALNAHVKSKVSTSDSYSDSYEKGKLFDCKGLKSGNETTVSCLLSLGSTNTSTATGQIIDFDTLVSYYSAVDNYQKAYDQINGYFKSNNFTDITINGVSSTKSVGIILSISVNGDKNYKSGTYPLNSKIVVKICNNQTN